MKQLYILSMLVLASLVAEAQYTIGQTTTGMTQNIYGQGFNPSVQGYGSGDIISDDKVSMVNLKFMLDDTPPEVLYIYETMPQDEASLMNGSDGKIIAQSHSFKQESYWYTEYKFEGLTLSKDKEYYALFQQVVVCEVGGGSYSGGSIYRVATDGNFNTTDYANAKFLASFEAVNNSMAAITHFSVASQLGATEIDSDAKTIHMLVEAGSDLSSISVSNLQFTEGAMCTPTQQEYDFSSGPVSLTLASPDNTTSVWKVSVSLSESTNYKNQVNTELSISPNPTSGDVIIVSTNNTGLIEVYNMTGSKVKTIVLQGVTTKANISDLPKGIYMFIEDGKKAIKIVKK
ncbi:T9SS type A sorting domain-containing protein [Saccharicrinis aurantiacus]|uniref:T9SS type A sorting domain-containing protein n=1 Tax=Saccharicrinis aurantiacus TaxID=1849719 RepID=UPI00094F7B0C|nr:T9SS type A sorting domain-containing protein [Saccharicrinis aurantiacus]